MVGCKRKRSPTPHQEEEDLPDPEEVPSIDDRVAPLLDVTPKQSGWTPEKYGRGKRQKHKQGGNPNKKQKNDNLHQKNATDQYLQETDGFYNLVKRSLDGNGGSRILKAMRKKHYKATGMEKPEGDQSGQNRRNNKNKKMRGKNQNKNLNKNNQRNSNQKNQNRQNRKQNNQQNIQNQQQGNQHIPNPNESSQPNTSKQNNYQPFDYSSVDFRQFQGGAGGVGRGGNVRTNFRGKVIFSLASTQKLALYNLITEDPNIVASLGGVR